MNESTITITESEYKEFINAKLTCAFIKSICRKKSYIDCADLADTLGFEVDKDAKE